jgi:hypothetical protein
MLVQLGSVSAGSCSSTLVDLLNFPAFLPNDLDPPGLPRPMRWMGPAHRAREWLRIG